MRTERILPALRQLDPERRALLELSFLRGIPDWEIAQLLGVTPGEVHRRRVDGVERLSDVLRLEDPEERRELAERLRTMSYQTWEASPSAPSGAGGTAARPAVMESKGPEPGGDRRRTMFLARMAVAITILTVAIMVVASGGKEEERASQGRGSSSASPPTGADRTVRGPRVALKPVARGRGQGVVQLLKVGARRRLLVSAGGLEPPGGGAYVVWLYRSVDDAKAIGAFKASSLRLNARLPRDAARYPALDISLEPRDANESHGGDSVLRAPLRAES